MAIQDIPIEQRQARVQPTSTPDFQSSTEQLAESQNSLSSIGAQVVQSASNQMASQLGYLSGKNPHGDLTVPLTEFDKNFANSYHAQAAATLSLQGQKLLEDAHVEMSKPNRLTPQLIESTNQQLQLGLSKISDQAPIAIKGELQKSFDSQLLNQMTTYRTKMISEQREDQKANIQNGIDIQIKNALEFGQNGDFKGSDAAVKASHAMIDNALANHFLTPEEARVAKETAVQSQLNGKYINEAMQSLKDGKYAEFEKNYSEKKPSNMTNEQWLATGRAMTEQVNFIQSLRTQDENLKSQEMINKISLDPSAITGTEWKSFTSSVSPLQAEQVKFKYIQALKRHQSSTIETDTLLSNFSNPEVWANTTEKTQNAAFNKGVDYTIQQKQSNGTPISHEEAQVQVAASAGGKITVFNNELSNKLHSANPAFIESAAMQIHALNAMGAGHALTGLTDEDKALYTTYESLRDSKDPVTAARDATTIVLNQDPEIQQANKQKWSNFVSLKTSGGVNMTDFALTSFGMNQASFMNPNVATVYGADILKKYSTFYQLMNGDENNAKKLTQQYIDQNYGDTRVNGGNFKTLHPLEKIVGFEHSDGVPYIQQDVIDHINQKFVPIKKMYSDNKSNEYWETLPLNREKHGIFSSSFDPIQVRQHIRTPKGEKTNTYNLVLQGNAFDNWDVAIQTDTGMRNLFQVAPYLGVISYIPNVKSIKNSYNKDHPLK